MSLFDWRRDKLAQSEAPLAARMRPRTLDEFIGQDQIVGHGRLLRRAIQADQLSSLIFYGPPGTGKTTLARIIANTTQGHFVSLNAVLAGVKNIRESIAAAKEMRGQHGKRTILFVDEVHRFNKAQQDALLPWVENGTVILIGATTENPYFEVNKALVSRSRIFQLKPLTEEGLRRVVHASLKDEERGYGKRNVSIEDEALDHLVNVSNGDARALLNAIELAVDTTPEDNDGNAVITLAVAEESIQRRAVLYDKEGDAHFDAISAFIKSCRGSDPDAALYWLARMVYAGEDPKYIFRRMVILASEDVGLTDPDALGRVNACAVAFDRVGMPEGRFHLSQAALVLATAKKSNSTMGFFDALKSVREEREDEVPNHLKDKNRDSEGFGHGEGYSYPHAFSDHWVAQQYLPTTLQGQVFYQPSRSGYEATIADAVTRRREAQLAAVETQDNEPMGLTSGPTDKRVERWLARAMRDTGQRLAKVRDHIFELAECSRHHVVLDLNAQSGLLTWEAIRNVPEGGVYSRVEPGDGRIADRSRTLSEVSRPKVIETALPELLGALTAVDEEVRFERILGHNAIGRLDDKSAFIAGLRGLLNEHGRIVLAETMFKQTQRLYALINASEFEHFDAWKNAEEAIYDSEDDPLTNWAAEDLVALFAEHDLKAQTEVATSTSRLRVTPAIFERWWAGSGDRASYRERLARTLDEPTIEQIVEWSRRHWIERSVGWTNTLVYLTARPA